MAAPVDEAIGADTRFYVLPYFNFEARRLKERRKLVGRRFTHPVLKFGKRCGCPTIVNLTR